MPLNMEVRNMKLRLRRKKKNTTHRLFDSEFYLSQSESLEKVDDAWAHYCKQGCKEGFDPHPLFSTRHYQNTYLGADFEANPLDHYLQPENAHNNPHPLFDARTYLDQIGNPALHETPLEHFLSYNNENEVSPSVFFDTKKYLFANPEVAPCGFVGLYHYIRYGKMQGRDHYIDVALISEVFNRSDRPDYDCVLNSPNPEIRFLSTVLGLDATKPTVVISCNKADNDYALTLKKVSQELSEVYDVNTVHVFGFDQAESESFTPFGPTFCLNWDHPNHDELRARHECALGILKGLNPIGAIYFDSHPSKTLNWLAETSVPIFGVVPEVSREKFATTASHFGNSCQRVVVPSEMASHVSEITDSELRSKIDFSETDFEAIKTPEVANSGSAALKQNMGIEPDTLLVVGGGDIAFDNGFDRFISVAASALEQLPESNLQFIWVGTIPYSDDAQALSMLGELEQSGVGDKVLICEDCELLDDAVASADILLMTHRSNNSRPPIREFLQAAKPIIWFKGQTEVERTFAEDPCGIAPGNMPLVVKLISKIASDRTFARQLITTHQERRQKATSIPDFVYDITKPFVYKNLERTSRLPREAEPHIIKMPSLIRGKRNRRRVIFTAPNWQISGVNTFIETLVNELNKLNFEAHVLFTTTQALAEQKSVLPDMPYQLLSQEPNIRPKRRKELLQNYLAAMAPCVFVPNYDYVASTVTPELQDNIATLGVLHSDDPQHYVHGYRMGPYWDAIVSVSQTIEDKLLSLNSTFQDKSSVIRYGIRDQQQTIPPRVEGSNEKLRIVYTGRIIQHQKLIFDFVDVAKKLNDYRDRFEMIFVGDGPQFEDFSTAMNPYVQSGLVQLLGRIRPEKISDVLLSSHVFSLTSEFEGLPLSMLEALGAGLVPVVTDVESGIGEVCVHEKNALISPIGQPEALADNLKRLSESTDLFNQLSLASRNTFIDEKLRAVDMAEQYAVVLDKMFDNICDAGCERTEKLIYCPNIERLLNVA